MHIVTRVTWAKLNTMFVLCYTPGKASSLTVTKVMRIKLPTDQLLYIRSYILHTLLNVITLPGYFLGFALSSSIFFCREWMQIRK